MHRVLPSLHGRLLEITITVLSITVNKKKHGFFYDNNYLQYIFAAGFKEYGGDFWPGSSLNRKEKKSLHSSVW